MAHYFQFSIVLFNVILLDEVLLAECWHANANLLGVISFIIQSTTQLLVILLNIILLNASLCISDVLLERILSAVDLLKLVQISCF